MSMLDKALSAVGLQTKSAGAAVYSELLRQLSSKVTGKPYAEIPTVYQAIKAIIDNAAQAPMIMANQDGEEVDTHQEVLQLFQNTTTQFGTKLSYTEFIQNVVGFIALKGESPLKRVSDSETGLTEAQVKGLALPSSYAVINPIHLTAKTSLNKDGFNVLSYWECNTEKININELIMIKEFNPYNAFRGLDPMGVLSDQLKLETAASDMQVSTLENDATPNMILETEKNLTADQRKDLQDSWNATHKGTKKSGKVAIVSHGLKANQLGFSNTEMQFTELLDKVDEKIIGTWRVPKAMFGKTDNINYATFLGQLKVFWTMTIIPMLRLIEDGLNKDIKIYTKNKALIKFDLSKIPALQDSINEFSDSVVKMTSAGFTRNELNRRYSLGFEDNKQWGDKYFIPFSMVDAGTGSIADKVPEKSVKKKEIDTEVINGRTYTKAQIQFIKGFNKLHDSIHIRFTSAMKKFFNGQRKRMLDAFDDSCQGLKTVNKTVELNVSWASESELLSDDMQPYEQDSIEQGVKVGERSTGIPASNRLEYMIDNATVQRLDYVTDEITGTTKRELTRTINQGIDDGESLEKIKDRIKKYFNGTNNRAEKIARTEITAQLNGGLLLQYDDAGITHKQWLTNIDGFERESHAIINGEVRRIDEPFSIGLQMPGDFGDPAETLNCRCSVLAVIEDA